MSRNGAEGRGGLMRLPVAAMAIAVCAIAIGTGGARAAGAGKELRFSIASDPKSLDALHTTESSGETVRYLTGGVLVRIDRASDKLLPELAESWKVTEGGRVVTFHLRAGLKFSDGAALDASDVARTLKRALDPKEASPAGDGFRSGDAVPEVRVASPLEIGLRYKSPKADIDRVFDQLAIVPANPGRLPASAGPFFIAEYRPGDFIRLARNVNYFKKDAGGKQLPYLDGIRLDIQQNHDIELSRFLRGEFQLIPKLDPEGFDRVAKERPGAARNLGSSLDSEFLWFNEAPSKSLPDWKRKWFTSAAFRHAVSKAIHREDIARVAYRGHAHPAAGAVSTSNRFWFNAALKPLTTDPAAAAKLLAAEGFTLRDGMLRDREGHAVEFSLITNAGNRPRERTAALIQSDLRAIGMRVNIVTLESGSFFERIGRTLDYEAAIGGFNNVEPDPVNDMDVWLSSGSIHPWWPGEKTPATPWEARIDELLLQQASEPSREARKKAVDEVQRIAMEQEPMVYLVNPDALCAISPAVHGAQPGVTPPQVYWNIEWLRLE